MILVKPCIIALIASLLAAGAPRIAAATVAAEGDLSVLNNIGATMVGVGDAYYNGKRMSAADALKAAGLAPIQPFAADDNALTSSNAYATARAAFVVADAKQALAWADLTYAIDLDGMNSSVTPLNNLVQTDRPFKWLNWDANRVKEMLKGSYLFGADPGRIIQDPESLRASSIRQASAWQMWAMLRDDVVTQLNSSDHNPAIRVDVSPTDSWDLNTPEMLKYYVKGGKNSNGKHGFIFSNANWDPYPLSNDLEAFTIALANMDIAVMLRAERFGQEFFTGEGTQKILRDISGGGFFGGTFGSHETWQHIQAQIMPVPPEGYGGSNSVEELEAQIAAESDPRAGRGRRHLSPAGDRPAGRHSLARRAQGPGLQPRIRPRPDRGLAGFSAARRAEARSRGPGARTGRHGARRHRLHQGHSGLDILSAERAVTAPPGTPFTSGSADNRAQKTAKRRFPIGKRRFFWIDTGDAYDMPLP